MSVETDLFTTALGLQPPWGVSSVSFDQKAGRIDFEVAAARGWKFGCPACGEASQAVHDTRRRSWRHLNFFQYQAHIHADLPRVRCTECGKTSQVPAPWARAGSGFTQLFEALVVTLCRQMPVNSVARLLGVGDDALWRVLKHYVEGAREAADFSTVRAVGIDETAAHRGQRYVSLFLDLRANRLLFGCAGRDQSTVAGFAEDLRAHGGDPQAVEAVCIDMSKAFIAGVREHLPHAAITFDVFHIVQLANQAVEEVRRTEVKGSPELRGTRWVWLKDARKWTRRQIGDFHHLSRTRLATARAWRLKEALRDLFAESCDRAEAATRFERWYSWARRCRLEPMKRLAKTLRAHLPGLLNGFDSGLRNGRLEGLNSLIQAAKARARGYRTERNLLTIAYLIAGHLEHLPASPFRTYQPTPAATHALPA
jgi:transposase